MKKSITKNYIYNLIYQIIILITPIITTPYVSKVLGAENIGIYSYTLSVVEYFILFGSLGIALYGQREIAYQQDNKEEYSKTFWEIIILRFGTMLLSTIIYYLLFIYKNNDYYLYYKILILEIVGNSIEIGWLFQGLEDFKRTITRNLIVKLISVISIFIFVKSKNDLSKYFLIYVLSILIGNASLWLYLPKILTKVKISDLNIFKHIKPTISLFIPQIAVQVYTIFDKTMLGMLTSDMIQVGIYEQSSKIVKLTLTIVTSMGTVVIPRIATLYSNNNKIEIQKRLNKSFHFVWLLGIPLTLGIIGIANNMVPWFLGDEFMGAIPVLQIGALLIMAIGFNNVTGMQYLIPIGKQNHFTFSVIIGAIINFVGNYFFIRKCGAIGAMFFSVVAETSIFIIQVFFTKKVIEIKNIVNNSLHCIISGVIMLSIIYPLSIVMNSNVISTIIIICIGIISYFIPMLIFKDDFIIEAKSGVLSKIRRK